jgi:hypothetical protein
MESCGGASGSAWSVPYEFGCPVNFNYLSMLILQYPMIDIN